MGAYGSPELLPKPPAPRWPATPSRRRSPFRVVGLVVAVAVAVPVVLMAAVFTVAIVAAIAGHPLSAGR